MVFIAGLPGAWQVTGLAGTHQMSTAEIREKIFGRAATVSADAETITSRSANGLTDEATVRITDDSQVCSNDRVIRSGAEACYTFGTAPNLHRHTNRYSRGGLRRQSTSRSEEA